MTTVSARVVVRNDIGRFIADIEGAAPKVIADVLDAGISASQNATPVRTGHLRGSFFKIIESRTRGFYANSAKYAYYQDQGAGPHAMIGSPFFRFYWEREGRMWIPGLFGEPDVIAHPGNPATHFMDAGWPAVRRATPGAMARYYPG